MPLFTKNWKQRFYDFYFGIKPKKLPEVKKGDIFIFNATDEKNPFKIEPPREVEVKDVKQGYVLYRFCGSSLFQNESKDIKTFCNIYIKKEAD